MAMDEVSYVNALLWHMQRPRPDLFHATGAGYSSVAAQVFLRVTAAFADAWTARIWFEFGRIDPSTELTPILACQHGMSSCVDEALSRYLQSPLPLPIDTHDGVALGSWLGSGGAMPAG